MIALLLMAAEALPKDVPGLRDVRGAVVQPAWSSAPATVLLFISTDCPIANRYAPEIARLGTDYARKKVQVRRVYIGSADGVEAHGREFKLGITAWIDTEKALVRAVGATVTPEAAVVDRTGTVRYLGRIDDRYADHGRVRPHFRKDLRIAIDEVLAGKKVSEPRLAATGCLIP